VGAVSESVVIEAQGALLETENGTLNQVIETRQITELPLNGRNLVQLAALSAGVSVRRKKASNSGYGRFGREPAPRGVPTRSNAGIYGG
jgi:hypothetical protein